MVSKNKKRRKEDNNKDKKEEEPDRRPRVSGVYKYSKRGQGILHEAIILGDEPCYVAWHGRYNKAESVHVTPNIEEATRIILPPSIEEYPYAPYEFVNKEELNDYFSRANTIRSVGELYAIAKKHFQKYVDQDKNIIIILAADSIFTWFQDLFPVTHYLEAIGGNDVGKDSIGYTFAHTGYRVIRGTTISGPNYARILGCIEPGQCVIIEDEGDMISEDPVKVAILKAGYELDIRIPKTNMNTVNQKTS